MTLFDLQCWLGGWWPPADDDYLSSFSLYFINISPIAMENKKNKKSLMFPISRQLFGQTPCLEVFMYQTMMSYRLVLSSFLAEMLIVNFLNAVALLTMFTCYLHNIWINYTSQTLHLFSKVVWFIPPSLELPMVPDNIAVNIPLMFKGISNCCLIQN